MTLKAYDVVINGHETTLLLDKHDAKIYGVTEDQDEAEEEAEEPEVQEDSAALLVNRGLHRSQRSAPTKRARR